MKKDEETLNKEPVIAIHYKWSASIQKAASSQARSKATHFGCDSSFQNVTKKESNNKIIFLSIEHVLNLTLIRPCCSVLVT
jgi:hypothetical protein